jgi:hypothetical protein
MAIDPPQPLQIRDQDVPAMKPILQNLNAFLRDTRAGLSALLSPESTGDSATVVVTVKTTSAWVTPSLQNGWVPNGVCQYRKDALGRVTIKGSLINTASFGTTIFTFPAAYRPGADVNIFPQGTAPATFTPQLQVGAGGNFTIICSAGSFNVTSADCSFTANDLSPVPNLLAPAVFSTKLKAKAQSLTIVRVDEVVTSGSASILGPVSLDGCWTDNGKGTITLTNVNGLLPDKTYTLTLRAETDA